MSKNDFVTPVLRSAEDVRALAPAVVDEDLDLDTLAYALAVAIKHEADPAKVRRMLALEAKHAELLMVKKCHDDLITARRRVALVHDAHANWMTSEGAHGRLRYNDQSPCWDELQKAERAWHVALWVFDTSIGLTTEAGLLPGLPENPR